MSFQITGLNVVLADFTRYAKQAEPKAVQAATEVIEQVEATARTFVPVDSGDTRDSISSEVFREPGKVVAEAGPTTRYAFFVENGTYKDAPQAFMGPALDRHSHEFEEALADGLLE